MNFLSRVSDSSNIEIVDLRELCKIIGKRKGLIISGIVGIILLAAVISYYVLKPEYEAQVLIRVANPSPLVNTQNAEVEGLQSTVNILSTLPKMTMQTHVSQLQSDALVKRVGSKLNLQEADQQGKLLSQLFDISIVKDTNLIRVKVRHNDPILARDLANTLSQEYIQFISEMSQEQMEQTITFLEKQYALIEIKLNEVLSKWNMLQNRRVTATPAEQAQNAYLETELAHLRKTLDLLAEETATTRIKGGIDFGQASILVVSAADTPQVPVRPNKALNMAIALLLGIIIFIPLAFLLERLDFRIKSSEDVEKYLDLPVLGLIPLFNSELLNITYHQPKTLAAESYRTLQTNLSYSVLGRPGRAILFTSPDQNVGKSTIISNLAVVLTQAGHRVLVVDCDLRKPCQHKIFGLGNSQGLLNVLLQDRGVAECVYKTKEGPEVLTCGPVPPNPLELISLKRTKDFWQEQLQFYEYVLVDAPPVLPVADAVVLSTQLDGVILVLDSNKTQVDTALEVKDRITRVNGKIIGVVLNRVKIKNKEYSYYYSE